MCSSDLVWIAISASAESVAVRVLELLGVAADPRFATFNDRAEHREELDGLVRDWCAARSADDVLAAFAAAEAAAARVYSMADVVADPHLRERGALVEVDGVLMAAPVARLEATPGEIREAGRALGADTESVLEALAAGPDWPARPR